MFQVPVHIDKDHIVPVSQEFQHRVAEMLFLRVNIGVLFMAPFQDRYDQKTVEDALVVGGYDKGVVGDVPLSGCA